MNSTGSLVGHGRSAEIGYVAASARSGHTEQVPSIPLQVGRRAKFGVRGATTSSLADGTGLHNVTSTMARDRLRWLEIG
jgi:hypothetical protein